MTSAEIVSHTLRFTHPDGAPSSILFDSRQDGDDLARDARLWLTDTFGHGTTLTSIDPGPEVPQT